MIEIEQARSWNPRVISKFETPIRRGDDLSLYRINPLAFPRDRAIAEAESIDLLLSRATTSGDDLNAYALVRERFIRRRASAVSSRVTPSLSLMHLSAASKALRACIVSCARPCCTFSLHRNFRLLRRQPHGHRRDQRTHEIGVFRRRDVRAQAVRGELAGDRRAY